MEDLVAIISNLCKEVPLIMNECNKETKTHSLSTRQQKLSREPAQMFYTECCLAYRTAGNAAWPATDLKNKEQANGTQTEHHPESNQVGGVVLK